MFACIVGVSVCLPLPEMGTEILKCHSTLTPVMALVGASKALTVDCHVAEVACVLISSRALYER